MLLCVVRSLLPSSPSCTRSGATRLSHPALRSIPCRAPSIATPRSIPTAPALARCAPRPRYYTPCPAPTRVEVLLGCCRGAADAAVPHQKVVAAIDAMAAVMRDLSNEML